MLFDIIAFFSSTIIVYTTFPLFLTDDRNKTVDKVDNFVDTVDNHLLYQRFSHFYNISGTHSYQQFTVHTLFI